MNQQRRTKLKKARGLVSEAKEIVESVRDEEQEAYDNLPESIMDSERGERMEEAIDLLDSAVSNLESAEEDIGSAIL